MMIDLTGIATSIIAGVFSILAIVIPLIIQSKMKDKQAAQTLANAIENSLGAIQKASEDAIQGAKPKITIPGVSPDVVAGVQYVLDHAGEEASHFGITPQDIADKINAKIGLANIQTNISSAANPVRLTSPVSRSSVSPVAALPTKS